MVGGDSFSLLRQEVAKRPRLTELKPGDAMALCEKVAAAFVSEPSSTWWWDSLRGPAERISYAPSDGLDVIRRLIGNDDLHVFLVATDDNPRPWPAFSGRLSDILELLGELPSFEFFIADERPSWVVFDTHHNSLVVCGTVTSQ